MSFKCLPLANKFIPRIFFSFRLCSSTLGQSTSSTNSMTANDGIITPQKIVVPKNEFERIFGPPMQEEWTADELRRKEEAIENNNWNPVFRNHGLLKFFLVCRWNPILLATSYGLLAHKIGVEIVENGTVDLLKIWPELNLFILALIVNHLIKKYFSRVVTVISVDSTRSIYRIGILTRWGGRRNEFARIGDFLTVSESNEYMIGKYAKFCWTFRSRKEFLILPTRQCEILDEHGAYAIFGDMKYFEGMEDRGTPIGGLMAGKNAQKLLTTAKKEEKEPKKLTSKTIDEKQKEEEKTPCKSELFIHQEKQQKIL